MVRTFPVYRAVRYFRKNGLLKTITRTFETIWRGLFRRRFVLFYVDLVSLSGNERLPEIYTVRCVTDNNEISQEELSSLIYYRGDKVIEHQLKTRFLKGAKLWLIKLENKTVGMVWSIRKNTIQPFYFPLTANDVHIFDNEIFHPYRGRGINPILINSVLCNLKKEYLVRAYIETKVENIPEIKSLAKSYFSKYGSAIKTNFFGSNITIWSNNLK